MLALGGNTDSFIYNVSVKAIVASLPVLILPRPLVVHRTRT